jgi:hypothetical protein
MLVFLLLGLLVQTPAELRSRAVVLAFEKATGYPNGRPGFVADHRIPLCAGGPDAVTNMQWEEVRASYVKDTFERALCVEMKRQGYILVKVATHR